MTPTKFSAPRVRTAIVPSESRIERVHSSGSCLGITRESESTFTIADSVYFNSPSLKTGTRIGKTNSAPPPGGCRTTPTVGARVSSRRLEAVGLDDLQERRAPGNASADELLAVERAQHDRKPARLRRLDALAFGMERGEIAAVEGG